MPQRQGFARYQGTTRIPKGFPEYLQSLNMQRAAFVGPLTFAFEALMVAILLISRHVPVVSPFYKSTSWLVGHLVGYAVLMAASLWLSHVSRRFRDGRAGGKSAQAALVGYLVVCLAFGVYISSCDYQWGGQAVTFVLMDIIAFCVFLLPPRLEAFLCTLTFLCFGAALFYPGIPNEGDVLNFVILYLSLLLFGLVHWREQYHFYVARQRMEQVEAQLSGQSVYDNESRMKNHLALKRDYAQYINHPLSVVAIHIHSTLDPLVLPLFTEGMVRAFRKPACYRMGKQEFLAMLPEVSEKQASAMIRDWQVGVRTLMDESGVDAFHFVCSLHTARPSTLEECTMMVDSAFSEARER